MVHIQAWTPCFARLNACGNSRRSSGTSSLAITTKIKNEMQVDIGQDRTDRTALRRTFFRPRHNSSHHEPRVQPFADQAQDERVCNSISNHLLQPIMLDVVKVAPDVRLEQVSNLLRDDDLPQC